FFFQAEDGIRDKLVTGVQTCALPISLAAAKASGLMESVESYHAETITLPLRYCSLNELRYAQRVVDPSQWPAVATSSFHPNLRRSEERRVGKECRSGWSSERGEVKVG